MSNPESSVEIPKDLVEGQQDNVAAEGKLEKRTENPFKRETESLRKLLWEKRQKAVQEIEVAEKKAILSKFGDWVMGRNDTEEWAAVVFRADNEINGVFEGEKIIENSDGDLKLAAEKIWDRVEKLLAESRKVDPRDGKPDPADPDASERLNGIRIGLQKVGELLLEEAEKK